jgi:hypothetical protein
MNSKPKRVPSLKEILAALPDEDRTRFQQWFSDYIALTVRNYEEIRADPERYAHFKTLTAEKRLRTMKERSDDIPHQP